MEQDVTTTQSQERYAGRRLVSWQVDEYHRHERSRAWYTIAAVLSTALIIYAIATANFMFAIIILMVGVITLISSFKEPDQVDIIITTTGVVIGFDFFEYSEIRDFSIVYEPPEVKVLYLTFKSVYQPLVSVPLEDVDPNIVRETLLPFVQEDLSRQEEHLHDAVRRLYKI